MKGYLYLLINKTGIKYVGSTSNLERRISEHQRKHINSKFTKSCKDWELVYSEVYDTIEEARKRMRGINFTKEQT